ncbi:MAG: GntR family transcriptional regulator [Burkholderiales bacterium]
MADAGRSGGAARLVPAPATPSFAPLYLQIKGLLSKSLEAREWRPGEAIPSEIDLARRYRVSQGTVRKAIDALAADNLVVRRQGKGTFVATHTEERSSLFRFLRIRRNDGADVAPVSRLLDVRRAKAGADVARLLAGKPGDAVLVLRRVLDYAGEPVVLDEITLPAALFRGLTKARYDAYRGSMYSFFESQFGVRMLKAQEKIRAVAADAATARILGTEPGAPLLAVDRVTLTYGDRPVEVRRGLCVTRAFHYLNELF